MARQLKYAIEIMFNFYLGLPHNSSEVLLIFYFAKGSHSLIPRPHLRGEGDVWLTSYALWWGISNPQLHCRKHNTRKPWLLQHNDTELFGISPDPLSSQLGSENDYSFARFAIPIYVAVPGRNRTLFRCVFRSHCFVRSALAWSCR